jgi:hypothetical protein
MDATPRRSPSGNWIVMLDGEGVKRAFDDLASDIDCRLHCTLVGAQRNGSRIEALTVFDHTGTFDVTAASVVDASGDADLGYAAHAPLMVEVDPARERQVASFPVRIGGVASDVAIDNAALASIRESFPGEHQHGRVRAGGGHIMRLPHSGDLWWMGIDLVTDGLDSADMARAERLGRELAWDFVQRMKSRMPGFANAYIVATGPQLGVRDTRQVEPRYMLTDDDVSSHWWRWLLQRAARRLACAWPGQSVAGRPRDRLRATRLRFAASDGHGVRDGACRRDRRSARLQWRSGR